MFLGSIRHREVDDFFPAIHLLQSMCNFFSILFNNYGSAVAACWPSAVTVWTAHLPAERIYMVQPVCGILLLLLPAAKNGSHSILFFLLLPFLVNAATPHFPVLAHLSTSQYSTDAQHHLHRISEYCKEACLQWLKPSFHTPSKGKYICKWTQLQVSTCLSPTTNRI